MLKVHVIKAIKPLNAQIFDLWINADGPERRYITVRGIIINPKSKSNSISREPGITTAVFLLTLLLFSSLLQAAPAGISLEQIRGQLQHAFQASSDGKTPAIELSQAERLHALYLRRDYQALWIGPDGLSTQANVLIEQILNAGQEGFEVNNYHLPRIRSLINGGKVSATNAAELELLLSDALFRLASDLYHGRFLPVELDPQWHIPLPELQADERLVQAVEQARVKEVITGLTPYDSRYMALRDALNRLRHIAAAGGWHALPTGPTLRRGDRDQRVTLLRERLKISGDLTMAPLESADFFDDALDEAVRFFQSHHGLEVDGAVGAQTLKAMNISVEQRITQVRVNLERWRWLPRNFGNRYILVNMAGYELELNESGHLPLKMRVIVGKTYRQTPAFSGRLTYLVVNPTWTVPSVILKEDIFPQLRSNPNYLAQQKIRVFDSWKTDATEISPAQVDWSRITSRHSPYKFRQDPGPGNALGSIKFMLNNPFDIYLHDTPKRELFDRAVRAFSSGCIRLERPLELAERLLNDNNTWNGAQLLDAIKSNVSKNVDLRQPVPIYFTYMTAWIDEHGLLQLRPDVYERDKAMAVALFGAKVD